MTPNRRFFSPRGHGGERGPSDEMLAVDAASEMRSFTLLYERFADQLYRYYLICTGDPDTADSLLRGLLRDLPGDLARYQPEDRSFSGWLFRRASHRLERHSSPIHRILRSVRQRSPHPPAPSDSSSPLQSIPTDFETINDALRHISAAEREVVAVHLAAGLSTLPTSEALRLPASLVSSHVNHAVLSLAKVMGVNMDVSRLSDQLRDVFNGLRVPLEQREQHLALIHGLFYGEQQVEDVEQPSTVVRDVAALAGVVVIGLIGLWVWGLFAPGDPRMPDSPPVSVEVGSSPDPTPSPVVTPEPDEEPESRADVSSEVCLAMDGKRVFDTFVRRFNQGDFGALHEMLPGPNYEHPLFQRNDMEMNPNPNDFFRHQDTELTDPDEIIEYLRGRWEEGERWEVVEAYPAEHYRNWHGAAPLEMYIDWKRENPELGMVVVAAMTRSADDFQTHSSQGRVTVDCGSGLILDWGIHPNESLQPEPLLVSEFLDAMSPLNQGERREVRALVRTDSRADGGALTSWEIRWQQAIWHDGSELERIDVQLLDGGEVIKYVNDSSRWRLDQRGWVTYGRMDDADLPEEISLPLPWIEAVPHLLREHADEISEESTRTLSRDLTYSTTGPTERWFEVDIDEGRVVSSRLREVTSNGRFTRPQIEFLKVERADRFDPGTFTVHLQPRFPEKEVDAPRFQVPERQWTELAVIEMMVGNDAGREDYRLRWNEVEFDLIVRPSRGGLDPDSIPEGVDASWATAAADYSFGTLVWAHRHFAGYPTDAIWDNGLYRFELAVDREAMSPEHNWSLGRLIDLVEALSAPAEEDVAERARVQDRASRSGTLLPLSANPHKHR